VKIYQTNLSMIEFNFIIGTFEDAVEQITRWAGSKPHNNVMHFDEKGGKGYLLITELEKGFFVRAWNYKLKEDTKFKIKSADHNYPAMFMINYLLMPESFLLEAGNTWPEKIKRVGTLNSIVLSSSHSEFSFIVKAGQQARALDICFTLEWLLQQFPAKKNEEVRLALSKKNDHEPVFFETFSIDDYKVISEILEKIADYDWDTIFLKSRVLTLMNELINNILSGNKEGHEKAPVYMPGMIEVEKKLNSILHEKLPNLKVIAKDFSISESTLKRQFKQVYGKSIYEYYLHKKMDLARRTLIEKDMAVSQVAYSLGYEKASPFIRMFKKQFGVSPGTLRGTKD